MSRGKYRREYLDGFEGDYPSSRNKNKRRGPKEPQPPVSTDIIINCKTLIPKTSGQRNCIDVLRRNDISFISGVIGTGKTILSMFVAAQGLASGKFEKILICRPAVEVGSTLGFLPGDLGSKLSPFMAPMIDALEFLLTKKTVKELMKDGTIEIASLQHIRGRTIRNSVLIVDESQNMTESEIKVVLGRIGEGSKFILVGDESQSDLPRELRGAFIKYAERFSDIEGIGRYELGDVDVVRHPLIAEMVRVGFD
jgi:phosphate starvation-inducible PhoH-like protein